MKKTGYTLIEMIFVITVIILIAMSTMQAYSFYRWQRIAAQLNAALEELALLGNQYYFYYCNNEGKPPNFNNTTITDLMNWAVTKGMLSVQQFTNIVQNPIGDAWQFALGPTPAGLYLMQISVNFPGLNQQKLQYLQGKLDPGAIISGTQLTWTFYPQQIRNNQQDNSLWIANNSLHYFGIINHDPGMIQACPL